MSGLAAETVGLTAVFCQRGTGMDGVESVVTQVTHHSVRAV